mmetsp:Transcript_39020/g.83000  ORF Transcript_39020/g.83000 Transcript_39020/m.83000 type:complete len:620 (-) Transcript_39020:256-2115(-)
MGKMCPVHNFPIAACMGVGAMVVVTTVASSKFRHWPDLQTKSVTLGDETYRVKATLAPAASGWTLKILAWIIGGPGVLREHLRRFLLNDNGIVRLRDLAIQIIDTHAAPLLTLPMMRLKKGHMEAHQKMAKEAKPIKGRTGLPYRSVLDYHEAYLSGESTPTRVLEALLTAMKELPQEFQVFREVEDIALLRKQAQESDKRFAELRPLSVFDGVPVAFKDMVWMKGLNTTKGTTPSWGSGASTKDDFTVAKLREAGALSIGLTLMTEFGTTPLGYSVHGKGPMNPYSKSHYSGGSSSGSAVGVALGLFPVALGFDGGGSIRIPSSATGLIGLKTTFGRVPFDDDYCMSVIGAGPMAATAVDAALFYEVIGKPSEEHFYQQHYGSTPLPPAHSYGFQDVENLSDLKLGVFQEWIDDCAPAVKAASRKVLAFLESKGAKIVQITIPNLEVFALAHALNISVDFSLGHERQYFGAHETLEPATRVQLALGASVSAVEFQSTNWIRGYASKCLAKVFEEEGLSAIFTPTMACQPPPMPRSALKTGESNTTLIMKMMQYIFLANLCGNPGITIPAGLSQEGLPIGVHAMAPHWNEHVCLRLANALDVPKFRSVPPDFKDLLKMS